MRYSIKNFKKQNPREIKKLRHLLSFVKKIRVYGIPRQLRICGWRNCKGIDNSNWKPRILNKVRSKLPRKSWKGYIYHGKKPIHLHVAQAFQSCYICNWILVKHPCILDSDLNSLTTQKQRFSNVLQIGVLKNCAIFTRKYLCWSLFIIESQRWKPAMLLKRDSNTVVLLWIL